MGPAPASPTRVRRSARHGRLGVIPDLVELTGGPAKVLPIGDSSAPEHGSQVSVTTGGPRRRPHRDFPWFVWLALAFGPEDRPVSDNVESVAYPSYRALRVTVTSGVARATIDNPPLNLLDATLMTDLKDFVDTSATTGRRAGQSGDGRPDAAVLVDLVALGPAGVVRTVAVERHPAYVTTRAPSSPSACPGSSVWTPGPAGERAVGEG